MGEWYPSPSSVPRALAWYSFCNFPTRMRSADCAPSSAFSTGRGAKPAPSGRVCFSAKTARRLQPIEERAAADPPEALDEPLDEALESSMNRAKRNTQPNPSVKRYSPPRLDVDPSPHVAALRSPAKSPSEWSETPTEEHQRTRNTRRQNAKKDVRYR